MKPKLIKNEADYEETLARIETLFDAKPGTPNGDELDLLVTLVEIYESKAFPIELPDPVSAIRFRMAQQGLKAKDLVPYIGSASKVSEVLSGQRTLSLAMIRNLVKGLGIPAVVLLQEPGAKLQSDTALRLGRNFPVAEMVKRGWFVGFHGTLAEAKLQLEDLMNGFVGQLSNDALLPALNRQHIRDGGNQDVYALLAWRIRVATKAMREELPAYKAGSITDDFLRELVKLSYFDTGPLLAKEFLNKTGIHLIVERHLSKTHLDGAAIKLPDGSPVVALTLRHDRLDNFWFTLLHELAHVRLHFDSAGIEAFFDDLSEGAKDKYEKEADELAANALIPKPLWKSFRLTKRSKPSDVVALSDTLRISPAIPAGRIRFEAKDYRIFLDLIGSGRPRSLFESH